MKEMLLNIVPVPKGRPRFYCGHAVTPEKTRAYEKQIREGWTHGIVKGEYLTVCMIFKMPIPQSYSKKKQAALVGHPHSKRGDLDNMVKAVLDALNGVAFDDDSKIWFIKASKEYAEEPSVWVGIS